jgi:hypothetical protein
MSFDLGCGAGVRVAAGWLIEEQAELMNNIPAIARSNKDLKGRLTDILASILTSLNIQSIGSSGIGVFALHPFKYRHGK